MLTFYLICVQTDMLLSGAQAAILEKSWLEKSGQNLVTLRPPAR